MNENRERLSMVFAEDEKRRMLHFKERGFSLAEIVNAYMGEYFCEQDWSFLRKYNQTGEKEGVLLNYTYHVARDICATRKCPLRICTRAIAQCAYA